MSTRRRRFCRISAFVCTAVVLVLVSISALCIPVYADIAITNGGIGTTPAMYLSFNFDVYQTKDLHGIHSTRRAFTVPLCQKLGTSYNYANEDVNVDNYYSATAPVEVPAALGETHTVGLDLACDSPYFECNASDIGTEYEMSYNFFIDALYGVRHYTGRVDLASVSFHAYDFYINGDSPLQVAVHIERSAYDTIDMGFVYSLQGDPELRYYSVSNENAIFDDHVAYLVVSTDILGLSDEEVIYVHNASLTFSDNDEIEATFGNEYKLEDLEGQDLPIDIQGTYIYDDLHAIDVSSHTIDYEFHNYTEWLGNAVGGFLGTEIFGGITFGGILMMIIGFFGVIWFLKVFAGG